MVVLNDEWGVFSVKLSSQCICFFSIKDTAFHISLRISQVHGSVKFVRSNVTVFGAILEWPNSSIDKISNTVPKNSSVTKRSQISPSHASDVKYNVFDHG